MSSEGKKKRVKFLLSLYYLSHFLYGFGFWLYPVLIPFFCFESHRPEEDYIPFFMMRGAGFLAGALVKSSILRNYSKVHQGMLVSCVGVSIFIVCVSLTVDPLLLVPFSFGLAIFLFLLDVFVSVCIMEVDRQNAGENMAKGFGWNNFGGFIGAFLLGITGKSILLLLALIGLVLAVFFYRQREKEFSRESRNSVMGQPEERVPEKKYMDKKLQVGICLLFIFLSLVDNSYLSWFPIFCVQVGYATKEEAALISSTMLLVMGGVRLFVKGQTLSMLRVCTVGVLFVYALAYITYFGEFIWFLKYVTPVLFLGFVGMLYPYYYALPIVYDYHITTENASRFIMSYMLGETVLGAIPGYLMAWIHPSVFFYYGTIFACLSKVILQTLIIKMQRQPLPECSEPLNQKMIEMTPVTDK